VSDIVFVEQRPDQGKQHMPEPGATIGREGCDITIADPELSRSHARILREGETVVIEDLGSTNGTFVNGERISGRRALAGGDEVRFGEVVWLLQPAPGATRIAQRPIADPQVTRARAIAEPQVTRARAIAEPPTERSPAGTRGDVPAPDFQPSAIRRIVPAPDAPATFSPGPAAGRRGSAATRLSATIGATVAVALTAAGVVLYYVIEPFK